MLPRKDLRFNAAPGLRTGFFRKWVVGLSIVATLWGISRGAPIHSPGGVSGALSQEQQPSYLQAATRAARQGDSQAALQTLRKAIKDQPELGLAEVMLAGIYLAGGSTQQARQMLEEAAVLYPADPEPHLLFADLAWRERRLTDASVQYERGRELAGDYNGPADRKRKMQVWALAGMGSVAETRGQNEQAQALFNELLEIDPNYALGRYRLGNILFLLGQPEQALEELQAASELSPTLPQPELTLAGLCQRSGDLEQTEQWLQRAIDSSSQDVKPLVAMARFQLEVKNDADSAAEFVARSEKVAPEATEPYLLAALVAWQQGKLVDAEGILEQLAIRVPNEPVVTNYLACVLAEQGDPDRRRRAEKLSLITQSVNPQSPETAAAVGWVAYQRGKFNVAEKQLRAASQQQPVSRDTKYYLARTLYRGGQLVAAQNLLADALNSDGLFVHLRQAREWQQQLAGQSRNN